MPDAVLLEADGLGKSFGKKPVLKAASFRAKRGSITALMGRNGSGKSMMLRIAIGRARASRCSRTVKRPVTPESWAK